MEVINLTKDIKQKISPIKGIQDKAPKMLAAAAEKMKDANFSAEGFVIGGTPRPKWKKRKKETGTSEGKRILHGRGTLQNSVKTKALSKFVKVGVDLNKVPYAALHNEGGRVMQNVRPHHRQLKNGKRQQVKGFMRRINMPQRKFLGYSPDTLKIFTKELDAAFNKIK